MRGGKLLFSVFLSFFSVTPPSFLTGGTPVLPDGRTFILPGWGGVLPIQVKSQVRMIRGYTPSIPGQHRVPPGRTEWGTLWLTGWGNPLPPKENQNATSVPVVPDMPNAKPIIQTKAGEAGRKI